MNMRKASIKETGEELTQEEWARFDAAVAKIRAERAVAPNGRAATVEPSGWDDGADAACLHAAGGQDR